MPKIKLPYKIGQTLYTIEDDSIKEYIIEHIIIHVRRIFAKPEVEIVALNVETREQKNFQPGNLGVLFFMKKSQVRKELKYLQSIKPF